MLPLLGPDAARIRMLVLQKKNRKLSSWGSDSTRYVTVDELNGNNRNTRMKIGNRVQRTIFFFMGLSGLSVVRLLLLVFGFQRSCAKTADSVRAERLLRTNVAREERQVNFWSIFHQVIHHKVGHSVCKCI